MFGGGECCALPACELTSDPEQCSCSCEFDLHYSHQDCLTDQGWLALSVHRVDAHVAVLGFCSSEHLQAAVAASLPEPVPYDFHAPDGRLKRKWRLCGVLVNLAALALLATVIVGTVTIASWVL